MVVWGGLRRLSFLKVLFSSMEQLFESWRSLWGLDTNWPALGIMSHKFKHIYIANVKRFLTNESENAWVPCRISLKRALFQIVRQMTAPPHISWATWFIWALLYFIIQHLSKYNIVLGWILRKENTIPENSHFGSSFLYAIFPLYLILIYNTSWNKYWVALERQVKNTAISEEGQWTFGL